MVLMTKKTEWFTGQSSSFAMAGADGDFYSINAASGSFSSGTVSASQIVMPKRCFCIRIIAQITSHTSSNNETWRLHINGVNNDDLVLTTGTSAGTFVSDVGNVLVERGDLICGTYNHVNDAGTVTIRGIAFAWLQ